MNTEVIVYQFGKVASTAIVAALNQAPGVAAYQSHFLGEDALAKTLKNLQSPKTTEYMAKHQEGQLMRNVALMRKINTYKEGLEKEKKIVFLTVVRDPIDWFYSAIAQDIEGIYLPKFREFLTSHAIETVSDEEVIEKSIPMIASNIVKIIKHCGGADVTSYKNITAALDALKLPSAAIEPMRSMVSLFLRPLSWFDEHFAAMFGFGLDKMILRPNGLYLTGMKWCEVYCIRYEDLDTMFKKFQYNIGIMKPISAPRANVSQEKKYADIINQAFTADIKKSLESASRSKYSSFFGYDKPRENKQVFIKSKAV
jgi:hypothetical protein